MIFFPAKALRIHSEYAGYFLVAAFLCAFLSCARVLVENPDSTPDPWNGARPAAILKTGEYPLWFQLTEDGPIYIESIEDAVYSAALIPWPFAAHVRFFLERDNALVMAVNREGFIKIAPFGVDGELAMYSFDGGSLWRQYTVGGLVFYKDKPAAPLYLDSFFLDVDLPPPRLAIWSFSMESNIPFPLEIQALKLFPAEEGWYTDTMRSGSDGLIYYRVRKNFPQPAIKMFRSSDLFHAGEEINADIFFNSIPIKKAISNSALPPLPEGFVYTGIAGVGDNLVAFWEEREEFYIGAAGFMAVKP